MLCILQPAVRTPKLNTSKPGVLQRDSSQDMTCDESNKTGHRVWQACQSYTRLGERCLASCGRVSCGSSLKVYGSQDILIHGYVSTCCCSSHAAGCIVVHMHTLSSAEQLLAVQSPLLPLVGEARQIPCGQSETTQPPLLSCNQTSHILLPPANCAPPFNPACTVMWWDPGSTQGPCVCWGARDLTPDT